MRHFIDGLALGTQGFIETLFRLTRERFGEGRESGARKLRNIDTSLRTFRDLQDDPGAPPG